jgi:hypothetical protein
MSICCEIFTLSVDKKKKLLFHWKLRNGKRGLYSERRLLHTNVHCTGVHKSPLHFWQTFKLYLIYIQCVPKRCIHIIIRNINLVCMHLFGTFCIYVPVQLNSVPLERNPIHIYTHTHTHTESLKRLSSFNWI